MTPLVKVLILGASGSGKTGAIPALLAAGYNVRLWDADVNAPLIRSLAGEAAERLSVITLSEKFTPMHGGLFPLNPTGWIRLCDSLRKWKDDAGQDLGGIHTWTPQDVLVIDTLTTISHLAYYHVRKIGGRESASEEGKLWQRDIGSSQHTIRKLMEMLHGVDVPCNVVVNCHINRTKDDGTQPTDIELDQARSEHRVIRLRGYPKMVGSKASKDVPVYFGNLLYLRGAGKDATFYTTPIDDIDVKTIAPRAVKRTYRQPTGLAEFFSDVRSGEEKPV